MKSLFVITFFIVSNFLYAKKTLESCQNTLVAINHPFPRYPSPEEAKEWLLGTSYAHVFVEGVVKVRYLVLRSGSIENLEITYFEYNLAGADANSYKSEYFDNFFKNSIFKTMNSWEYETIDRSCIVEKIFEWKYE